MKTNILKLSTLILPIIIGIAFISAGCQKDDDIFELQIGDENAVIVKEVDGIEFKFCLLNEQGEPATIFNEGENFTFQFSYKNNTEKRIFRDYTLLNENGFCEVRNLNKSFGMPYEKPVLEALVGKVAYGILPNNSGGEYFDWIPQNDIWNRSFVTFKKRNDSFLTKGLYYTKFIHSFDFGSVKTDKLTFKINFEIK